MLCEGLGVVYDLVGFGDVLCGIVLDYDVLVV